MAAINNVVKMRREITFLVFIMKPLSFRKVLA